jgi:hypothetical protein
MVIAVRYNGLDAWIFKNKDWNKNKEAQMKYFTTLNVCKKVDRLRNKDV